MNVMAGRGIHKSCRINMLTKKILRDIIQVILIHKQLPKEVHASPRECLTDFDKVIINYKKPEEN